jgi:hypothetical protein
MLARDSKSSFVKLVALLDLCRRHAESAAHGAAEVGGIGEAGAPWATEESGAPERSAESARRAVNATSRRVATR